ncbi:MAG: hypothetical protein LQ348_003806 [Seirophora lacunosa]|nr:MAG: hypothetical protein LQ348_003806 [Seirophora lacunosa]
MAPSSGYILVPKALRLFKFAVTHAGALLRSKLPQLSTGATNAILEPIRLSSKPQPIHRIALLRQTRSSAARNFSSQAGAYTKRFDRPAFQNSKVGQAVTRSFGSPFASTLRPNLTGGALPRTAGGYSLGGTARGVRHFSHTGGAQAQVIQNVSAGVRAFCLGGGKARFDGFDQTTGAKRFKAVSEAEDHALRKIQQSTAAWSKGADLEFRLNPTITAMSASFPTSTGRSFEGQTLGTEGVLDTLSLDFARALKDLCAVLTDLKRLATFGDLPISFTKSDTAGPTLSVRFAGCDAEAVGRLCDEVGVRRGVVREDEAWNDDRDVEMALLFPFATTEPFEGPHSETALFDKAIHARDEIAPEQMEWRNMMSPFDRYYQNSDDGSIGFDQAGSPLTKETPHYSHNTNTPRSPSGYESLRESDFAVDDPYFQLNSSARRSHGLQSEDLHGLESIYRFLAECDRARR